MNKNHARRCLTGFDRLYTSQIWTGSMYWQVRTKLWRRAGLTIPRRMEVVPKSKALLQRSVDQHVGHPISAVRIPGQFGTPADPHPCVSPRYRGWQRMMVNDSWLTGLDEITGPAEMKVDLHHLSVSWWIEDQVVALLLAIRDVPDPAHGEAA